MRNTLLLYLVVASIEARPREVESADDQEICTKKNGEIRFPKTNLWAKSDGTEYIFSDPPVPPVLRRLSLRGRRWLRATWATGSSCSASTTRAAPAPASPGPRTGSPWRRGAGTAAATPPSGYTGTGNSSSRWGDVKNSCENPGI